MDRDMRDNGVYAKFFYMISGKSWIVLPKKKIRI